ncbi:amidase signature enzyme [Phanerochaete sordida]|uniref:Amidase signature enzyme n=1 Tax=Phanerochaete sordida TaxID=48140 RepID=A0A9P3L9K8_9APHY|nr:amidase signature enzyme [Phanerochaete sordida]
MFPFTNSEHAAACARKKQAIADLITRYASQYDAPVTQKDAEVLGLSLTELTERCTSGDLTPSAVLDAYCKKCLAAHARTNCLADLMFDSALRGFAPGRALSGVPVSLKDVVDVAGHDTTLGFSSRAHRPATADAPIVRLLRDAGALLHVKTTVPTGLLSFECTSDLFGETTNPYNPKFSPGASTGGGAALLAQGGSMIEIATDIGGSVRYPPAYCGVYGMKASSGRFPTLGLQSCAPGLDRIQTASPLAKTLDDLQAFWERIVRMKPWEYDHTCVPIPWRSVDFVSEGRKPKWAVIWNDGLYTPTPACRRALQLAVDALRDQGHEVIDFDGPNPIGCLTIGFPLAFADGGQSVAASLSSGERINGAVKTLLLAAKLPLILKRFVANCLRWFSSPSGRNDAYASLLECLHPCTISEERALAVRLEEYRGRWTQYMTEQGIDFVLTVPHSLPPMPRGGTDIATLLPASYCFLFNILDLPAGVVPTTFVDKDLDRLPSDFKENETWAHFSDAERDLYSLYDASAMHGLPLAVQIAGKRFEEEKVLEGMQAVKQALKIAGIPFVQREF